MKFLKKNKKGVVVLGRQQKYEDLFKELQHLMYMSMHDKKLLWRVSKTLEKAMKEYKKEFGVFPNGRTEYMKLKGTNVFSRAKPYDYDIDRCIVFHNGVGGKK